MSQTPENFDFEHAYGGEPSDEHNDFEANRLLMKLYAERNGLASILRDMIRIWEGPRELAALQFATTIVKARKQLESLT